MMPKSILWKASRLKSFRISEARMKVHVDQVGSVSINSENQRATIGIAPALIGVRGWVALSEPKEVENLVIELAGQYLRVIDVHPRTDVEQALKSEYSSAHGFQFLYPNDFIPTGNSQLHVHAIFADGTMCKVKSIIIHKRMGSNDDPISGMLEHEVFTQSNQLNNVYLSKSWRWTIHFRRLVDLASKVKTARALIKSKDLSNERLMYYKNALAAVLDSSRALIDHERAKHRRLKWDEDYQLWLEAQKKQWDELDKLDVMARWNLQPLISVVVPVYNVDPIWLNKCVESVVKQVYPNWELCLYDDASTSQETIAALKAWEKKDSRIQIEYGKENVHISQASNRAIDMATGDFIALLDNDDEITEDALFQIVKALNAYSETDVFFSDEDKLEMDGRRSGAYFKPGFNKHLFWSNNYLCHFTVIRSSVGKKVGWFRAGFEGSQDFDLFLRLSQVTDKIRHLPMVLYHWRKIPGSTAADYSSKGYANATSIKALSEHIHQLGINGSVHNGQWMGSYRIKYAIDNNPLVSIIIPFKDQVALLKACVRSILELTKYKNYEIILVNNMSEQEETFRLLQGWGGNDKIRVVEFAQSFNFSRINNLAAEEARGEYLVFLNNDTKVIAHDWLSAMLEYAQQEDVGAVGAKLLYEDCTIQHAGVLLGVGGVATHAFHGFADGDNFAFGQMNIVREYMAVSAACMMVKKSKFLEVGGMDVNLPIAYNDVDLCLNFRSNGWKSVYTPYAKLFHFESKSRGYDNTPEKRLRLQMDTDYLYSKWGNTAKEDAYHNPNLSKSTPDFSIAIS